MATKTERERIQAVNTAIVAVLRQRKIQITTQDVTHFSNVTYNYETSGQRVTRIMNQYCDFEVDIFDRYTTNASGEKGFLQVNIAARHYIRSRKSSYKDKGKGLNIIPVVNRLVEIATLMQQREAQQEIEQKQCEAKRAVEAVKEKVREDLRDQYGVGDDHYICGCEEDGFQLRIRNLTLDQMHEVLDFCKTLNLLKNKECEGG